MAPVGSDMQEVLVFGGTAEGRDVAQLLSEHGTCRIFVSSLTEYGGTLVEGLANVEPLTGRMLPHEIEEFLRAHALTCVVDATHPYAVGVSKSIAGACESCGVPLYRVLREDEPEGPWVGVDSAEEAAAYVAGRPGAILLTTGSNDLPTYVQAVDDFQERLYARILPVATSLAAATDLGIPVSNIIAMRGPFSKQLNVALMREFDVKTVVTKASGKAGGFWEKVEAAQECGAELVVIHRPVEEEGMSVDELMDQLAREYGL